MKSIYSTIIKTSLVLGGFSAVIAPINLQAQTIVKDSVATTSVIPAISLTPATLITPATPVTPSKEIYDYAMSKCFLDMPDDVMPLLSTVNRADFIDFWASHMTAKVTNKLQGSSEMDMLSNDYLHIKMGNSSEVAIKLIPIKRDTVICMSYTVHAPLADSHVELYNLEWERLSVENFLEQPQLKDFFVELSDTISATEEQTFRMAIAPLTIYLRSIILSPDNTNLTYLLTSVKELTEEQQKTMKPYLKDSIVITLK